MNMAHQSLETVTEVLQLIGFEVAQQYADLVFVSDNLFILKFTEDPEHMDLYFNVECEEERAQAVMGQLEPLGELHELLINYKGAYSLTENEDDTLSVEFFDLADP